MEGMEKIIENLHSLKKQSNLGQPTQISKDSDVCPLCNGTGWIPVEKDGETVFRECKCRQEQINHNRLKFANVPEPFRNLKLADFNIACYKEEKIRNWSGLLARLSKIILTTSRRFKERELDCTSIQKQKVLEKQEWLQVWQISFWLMATE